MYLILRPLIPPLSLMYLNMASVAGAISLYPGAAGPVSGWWLPIRICFAVIPGADAVAAPEDDEDEPELPPQPAAIIATAAVAATMAGVRTRCDLFMWCLPPGVRWPADAGARS